MSSIRILTIVSVLGIGASLFACRNNSKDKLVRRSLPGFSLELPTGVEKLAELDYAAGKLRLDHLGGGKGLLAAYWSFGKVVSEPAALEIARAAARSDGLDPKDAKLLERKPGEALLMSIDAAGTKLQSYVQCGARVISLATFEMDERTHRKILGSLRCEPDPARETATASIPIAIDLPGFTAYQRTASMLGIMNATSVVMLRPQSSATLTIDYLERESATVFKAMGLDAQAQPRRGNVIPFVRNADGDREWGVMRFIDCGDSKILVVASSADTASAQDIEQRVEAARCLAPGESPPVWPDLPPEPPPGK